MFSVPYFAVSRPPFACLVSPLHVYLSLCLLSLCLLRDSWLSMPCFLVGLRLLLFVPYGILPEMCLPFVLLTLDHLAPRLGP
jgi:hypothetical protein